MSGKTIMWKILCTHYKHAAPQPVRANAKVGSVGCLLVTQKEECLYFLDRKDIDICCENASVILAKN